jgi:hypothetical protein
MSGRLVLLERRRSLRSGWGFDADDGDERCAGSDPERLKTRAYDEGRG